MTSRSIRCLAYIVIFIVAVSLTLASRQVMRPALEGCAPSYGYRCSPEAGFPFVFVEDQFGYSPTSDWGKLGPEDPTNPITFLLNVLVYGVLLLFVWRALQMVWERRGPGRLVALSPFVLLAVSALIAGSLGYRPTQPATLPTPTPRPEDYTALIGNWRGTDAISGREVEVIFSGSNQFTLGLPDGPMTGSYEWSDMRSITIRLETFTATDIYFCGQAPTFFATLCQTTVAAYPVPLGVPREVATLPPRSAYPAPPVPTEVLVNALSNRIFGYLTVEVEADTLILIAPAGTSQTFERIIP